MKSAAPGGMSAVMPTEPGTLRTKLLPPFVSAETRRLRAAIVAPPAPALAAAAPLSGESSPIFERAQEQHHVFVSRLQALGVQILASAPGSTPLGSACADAAVVFPDGAFVLRPSELARRAEVAAVEAVLAEAGVPVVGRLAPPGLLDGGDVLFTGDTLYLGVPVRRGCEIGIPSSPRGNAHGREQLAAYARERGWKVVEVTLAAEATRLRAIAAFIAPDLLLLASGLCEASAFAGLRVLEVPRGEDFAAGVLVLGERRVLSNLRFRETLPLLRKAKVSVEALDLWEFGKAGLTPSLLALALERE